MAKINTPGAIRGTQDIFGQEQERFGHVVDTFDRVRRLYNFRRVEMPVFEATAVFARSLGETTDVVSKEMYTFPDRGGDSLTLRPEFTAGLARAYLTNGWQQYAPLKLATHGPLFRYERPQKGRYRQFHQIDAEIIGAAEPQADVELLVMADQILRELGITEGVTLQLNTLGDAASRDAWRDALITHFQAHKGDLSKESQDRLERNPLRILDSKEPQDRPIADAAPDIDAFLTDEAGAFFESVTSGLMRQASPGRATPGWCAASITIATPRSNSSPTGLAAQGTVLGGGRYDGLIENLGGPHTPAVGWAAGIERLAMLCDEAALGGGLDVIIALEDDRALAEATAAQAFLRNQGISSDMIATGSPRKRYDKAAKTAARVLVSYQHDGDKAVANIRSAQGSDLYNRIEEVLKSSAKA